MIPISSDKPARKSIFEHVSLSSVWNPDIYLKRIFSGWKQLWVLTVSISDNRLSLLLQCSLLQCFNAVGWAAVEWWDVGVVIWDELQTCMWSSRCYCHSLSLAPVNPDWFYLPGFHLSGTCSPGLSRTNSRRAVKRLCVKRLCEA